MAQAERIADLAAWAAWLRGNRVAARQVRGAKRADPTGYFLRVHALTETILRRVLLVGLRRMGAQYSEASAWLDDNDMTPSRANFPGAFDALFSKSITFGALTPPNTVLFDLWDLWLDYTKIVRNHLAHGARTYPFDWVQLGVKIDQAFIMLFCKAMEPHVGGPLGGDLRQLNPRLGMGTSGLDIGKLMGRKNGKPRPTISLQSASVRFAALGIK